jgi:hypothetical protein
MTQTGFARTVATAPERDRGWHGVDAISWTPAVAAYNYGPCGLVRAARPALVDTPSPSRAGRRRTGAPCADGGRLPPALKPRAHRIGGGSRESHLHRPQ